MHNCHYSYTSYETASSHLLHHCGVLTTALIVTLCVQWLCFVLVFVQVSIYDDNSTDDSLKCIDCWRDKLQYRSIALVLSTAVDGICRGPGYARNQAVKQSTGKCLCFLDSDDVMFPQRIRSQHEVQMTNCLLVSARCLSVYF